MAALVQGLLGTCMAESTARFKSLQVRVPHANSTEVRLAKAIDSVKKTAGEINWASVQKHLLELLATGQKT